MSIRQNCWMSWAPPMDFELLLPWSNRIHICNPLANCKHKIGLQPACMQHNCLRRSTPSSSSHATTTKRVTLAAPGEFKPRFPSPAENKTFGRAPSKNRQFQKLTYSDKKKKKSTISEGRGKGKGKPWDRTNGRKRKRPPQHGWKA